MEFTSISPDLIRGKVEPMIMKCLSYGEMYSAEIVEVVKDASGGTYVLKLPTLYSALQRLQKSKLIIADERIAPENGLKRKYYTLTESGKESLVNKKDDWRFSKDVLDTLLYDGIEKFRFGAPRTNQSSGLVDALPEQQACLFGDCDANPITLTGHAAPNNSDIAPEHNVATALKNLDELERERLKKLEDAVYGAQQTNILSDVARVLEKFVEASQNQKTVIVRNEIITPNVVAAASGGNTDIVTGNAFNVPLCPCDDCTPETQQVVTPYILNNAPTLSQQPTTLQEPATAAATTLNIFNSHSHTTINNESQQTSSIMPSIALSPFAEPTKAQIATKEVVAENTGTLSLLFDKYISPNERIKVGENGLQSTGGGSSISKLEEIMSREPNFATSFTDTAPAVIPPLAETNTIPVKLMQPKTCELPIEVRPFVKHSKDGECKFFVLYNRLKAFSALLVALVLGLTLLSTWIGLRAVYSEGEEIMFILAGIGIGVYFASHLAVWASFPMRRTFSGNYRREFMVRSAITIAILTLILGTNIVAGLTGINVGDHAVYFLVPAILAAGVFLEGVAIYLMRDVDYFRG